ncbi:hydrogenase isoenzymes nickel incorporation protein HypB (plasmid) [Rhodovastum atsumiense]|uniref:hydrogenase nickel incorporation protein HypB n=1 Tax=Rhodovastum atsumiense TaxID=504468 RepID=UPI002023DC6E|nr:hydrogenase nickel incorporation protein HypB [Rhodovastum atsumiense]CAH2605577.1 hydrogenase isoenzymes nickel incorporation protein HypB [Rhodovastum atsumiense]
MCTTCGCSGAGVSAVTAHAHDGHHHDHDHGHHHHHHHDGSPDAHAHGDDGVVSRTISLERDILAENDRFAGQNRARFARAGVLALNFVSSPGSGKTTLLVSTIKALGGRVPAAVIEGDQQTSNDAERIRAAGAPAVQINTGKGCHLDAHMVGHACDHLDLVRGGVLFIENVGNLVCPAAFDLGEATKVAVISVTEGDDKPIKYPDMFAAAGLVLVNKVDLAPYVDADIAALTANARRVNPSVEVLALSARTGEGMDAWLAWLEARRLAAMG